MKLYIDQDNVISLMKSKALPNFSDCADFVRKHLDVHYNFPKENLKSDSLLMAWFSNFGQGVTGTHTFASNETDIFPQRPVKSNFYNAGNLDLLTSVYLLNDEHTCDVISAKSCIMIGKIGEEIKLIHSLLLENTETRAITIASWKNYLPSLPLTDIIICDNHYFKNEFVYKKNDNEIIRSLAGIPKKSPVNVVIIVKEGEVDNRIDLSSEQKKIKELVKKASNSSKSTVTILTTNKTHDRNLITNYYRVKHGSCFHLKDNGLKDDVMTEIKTHGKKNNEENSKSLVSVFQKIASSPVQCFGDKKSNFLNF